MSSSSQMIINGANFNPNASKGGVSYGKVKVNANGGKSIGILNASLNKPLHLATPLMMTWGLNANEFEQGKKTYDMSLQFPREEDANHSEETDSFLKNMQDLEEKIKADAITNCKDWFGKPKMTAEVVDALWSPMLKYPKDPSTGEPDMNRCPTIRLKFDYYDGKFHKDLEFYDLERNCIYPPENESGEADLSVSPESLIQKTQNVAMVMKCGGLWFVGGKFGVTWKVVQGMVQPRATLRGKCHISLNTKSQELMRASATAADEEEEDEENVGVVVGDSDEEDTQQEEQEEQEEEEEQEEAVEPPKPAPKKKRVVRKKATAGAEA